MCSDWGATGDVGAMTVFHVQVITIAATEEMTTAILRALNQRSPTARVGEVEWYVGSEYDRGRDKDP